MRDRFFFTVAARSDQNSAFGTNFQHVLYPKASVSWLMSDEDWFPEVQLARAVPLPRVVWRERRPAGPHEWARALLAGHGHHRRP